MKINEKLYRPTEVDLLYGNSIETRKKLNWEPKTNFEQLVKKMITNDINLLEKKIEEED
jgi:GDPmannose 4,6-dehydratase